MLNTRLNPQRSRSWCWCQCHGSFTLAACTRNRMWRNFPSHHSLFIPLTQELLKVYCPHSLLLISCDTTDYPVLCAQTIFSWMSESPLGAEDRSLSLFFENVDMLIKNHRKEQADSSFFLLLEVRLGRSLSGWEDGTGTALIMQQNSSLTGGGRGNNGQTDTHHPTANSI